MRYPIFNISIIMFMFTSWNQNIFGYSSHRIVIGRKLRMEMLATRRISYIQLLLHLVTDLHMNTWMPWPRLSIRFTLADFSQFSSPCYFSLCLLEIHGLCLVKDDEEDDDDDELLSSTDPLNEVSHRCSKLCSTKCSHI